MKSFIEVFTFLHLSCSGWCSSNSSPAPCRCPAGFHSLNVHHERYMFQLHGIKQRIGSVSQRRVFLPDLDKSSAVELLNMFSCIQLHYLEVNLFHISCSLHFIKPSLPGLLSKFLFATLYCIYAAIPQSTLLVWCSVRFSIPIV